MSEPTDVQRFQELKASMEKTHADISRLQGVQAEKQKQLEAILAKHNCKTVDELRALSEKLKVESEALVTEVESYLKTAASAIEEMNTVLST